MSLCWAISAFFTLLILLTYILNNSGKSVNGAFVGLFIGKFISILTQKKSLHCELFLVFARIPHRS